MRATGRSFLALILSLIWPIAHGFSQKGPERIDFKSLRRLTAQAPTTTNFSLRFYGNGVNDIDRVKISIDAPHRPADVGADFTLEWWMKANLAENGSNSCGGGGDSWINGNIIFDRDIFGLGDFGDYGVSLANGRIAFGVNNGSSGQTICGSANVADGAWHHVAVTRRQSDGQMRIFVDGQIDRQGAGPTGNVSYRDGRPTAWPNDPFLVIGAEKHDVGPEYPSYSGWIDEVRISSIVRYSGAFPRPTQPFATAPNTVALYHFDEGSGNVINDTSGAPGGPSNGIRRFGGNPAGPEWSTSTPFGCAAVSPASRSFAASGGNGSFNVLAETGCAWSAVSNAGWITITSSSGNTVNYTVATNTAAANRSGTISAGGATYTVFQGAQFGDVPPGHLFYNEIGRLSARGVTVGCGGGNFCPDAPVTREQMAAFIIRALGEFNPPPPAQQRFADVPPSNIFYAFIEQMAIRQITLGCGGGNYCPSQAVTREQMAAFIIRALGEFDPPTPGSQRYNDVPPTNIFYNFIDRMAVLGITQGCSASPPLYCPAAQVARAQMAAFLVRAFNL